MGVDDKVFYSVTFIISICCFVTGNYGFSPEERLRNLRSFKGSETTHPSSRRNEPSATKYVKLDQTAPISLFCNENNMTIIVQADLHNNGILVSTEELLLGQDASSADPSCRPKAFSISGVEYVIEASLHGCGTLLTIEEDSLVYSNVLTVSPLPTSSGIIRTSSAIIPIACHYQRRHVVSSEELHPTWAPFTSTVAALDLLDFSLRLMTADWRSESSSKKYLLGEPLHIEASVSLSSHVPLRIFMDTCIATMDPDMNSEPRYAFIQNHGCLSVEGSHAQFMPRLLEEKLQVKMDAFVFPEGFPESEIYIACQLRVTAASERTDATNKACTYVNGGWLSVDGEDVCGCCDSHCLDSDADVLYTLDLPPFTVGNKH